MHSISGEILATQYSPGRTANLQWYTVVLYCPEAATRSSAVLLHSVVLSWIWLSVCQARECLPMSRSISHWTADNWSAVQSIPIDLCLHFVRSHYSQTKLYYSNAKRRF